MEHARIPEQQILFMMGKRSSVYSEKRVSELFESYKKAYSELALFSEQKQTEEIEKLKARIRELEDIRLKNDREMVRIRKVLEDPRLISWLENIQLT